MAVKKGEWIKVEYTGTLDDHTPNLTNALRL